MAPDDGPRGEAGEAGPGGLTWAAPGRPGHVDLTLTLTFPQLLGLLASGSLDGIEASGDQSVLRTLMGLTDRPDPNFPVVTP